ncbi:hypothetical protein ABNF97_27540 [Plantactinospora sp. B6F1]|uniref:hypothetical protein n=1 Tax=Plantactinospora sp. B6F1 TaxID=3158971 RepID=UPI00102C1579
MNRVDPLWKVVQEGLATYHPDRIEDHPYVRFYMLNEGRFPDFLGLAEQAHPEVYDELMRRYRQRCSGALDEEAPGRISPTSRTAQHFYYLVRLVAKLGSPEPHRICEIGGGYGNMMRMLVQLGLCRSYHVVDIAGVVDLQRRYAARVLDAGQLARTRVLNVEDEKDVVELSATRYDVALSFFAVSEVPYEMRQWYLERVLFPASAVYLVGQQRWRAQPVGEHLIGALAERFSLDKYDFFAPSDQESPTFELFADRRADGADSVPGRP